MTPNLPAIITTIGLVFDIIGACFVAFEVVRSFDGPTSIDIGDAGSIAGDTQIVPNPEFVKYERRKHRYMKAGLVFLVVGFILQAVGTWYPIWCPVAPVAKTIFTSPVIPTAVPNAPASR